MDNKFNEKICGSLEYGTRNSVEMKDQVWGQIQGRIQFSGNNITRMDRKRRERQRNKGRVGRIIGIGTVAVALLLTFFIKTQPGRAAISKIRELFEPEKKITQELEGTEEETDVSLLESKKGYIIYVDEELYKVERYEEKERIVPRTKAEGLPEVFMEISRIKHMNPHDVALDMQEDLSEQFSQVDDPASVKDPIEGILLSARSGNNAYDTVVKNYIVDSTKGGTFVIKHQYFMEAAEGHGARFYHMLEEFQIVEMEE